MLIVKVYYRYKFLRYEKNTSARFFHKLFRIFLVNFLLVKQGNEIKSR